MHRKTDILEPTMADLTKAYEAAARAIAKDSVRHSIHSDFQLAKLAVDAAVPIIRAQMGRGPAEPGCRAAS
jgi:hypothetical protein